MSLTSIDAVFWVVAPLHWLPHGECSTPLKKRFCPVLAVCKHPSVGVYSGDLREQQKCHTLYLCCSESLGVWGGIDQTSKYSWLEAGGGCQGHDTDNRWRPLSLSSTLFLLSLPSCSIKSPPCPHFPCLCSLWLVLLSVFSFTLHFFYLLL